MAAGSEPNALALRENSSGADGSGAMFDGIAKRYDLLNRLMSFGIDRGWRRALVGAMPAEGPILDLATGTADVALAIAQAHPKTTLVGLDPSVKMLDVGRVKVGARAFQERITLLEGDAPAPRTRRDHHAQWHRPRPAVHDRVHHPRRRRRGW